MPKSSVRIGLLSDTHGHWDERMQHHLKSVDEIWHAGDIGGFNVLDALVKIAPVKAVYGNIDDHTMRSELPEWIEWDVHGLKVLMIHIGGRPGRYEKGIRSMLKTHQPDVFICGHSHLLRVEKDASWGGLYINPGAAGKHGFHRIRTMLRFDVQSGLIENLEVIELESIR
jgi:putative phosphoesterase